MTKKRSRAATDTFRRLAQQGQQIADAEQRKFAMMRDPKEIYKLVPLEGLNYVQRQQIVKRFKPRRTEDDESKIHSS